jgi:hypothetical protein
MERVFGKIANRKDEKSEFLIRKKCPFSEKNTLFLQKVIHTFHHTYFLANSYCINMHHCVMCGSCAFIQPLAEEENYYKMYIQYQRDITGRSRQYMKSKIIKLHDNYYS